MTKEKNLYKLHEAVLDNDIDLVKVCISEGCDVNERDENTYTPLHYAVQDGYVEIAKFLLDAGAEVDAKDEFGNTPLSTAVYNFNEDASMIDLLLRYGANKFIENNFGVSPYSLAKTIEGSGALQYLK